MRPRFGSAPRRRRSAARFAAAWCAAAVAVLVGVSVARAGESIFSLQFLGYRVESPDPRARGLGALGVALDDAQTALTLNPASLAALHNMTLSLMGGGVRRTSRDGTLEEQRNDTSFPHVRAALPVSRNVVLSLGAMTLRHYRSGFSLPVREVAGVAYHEEFEREGSLYEFPLGVAAAIGSRLHVGATLDLVLGTVDETWSTRSDSLLALRTRRRDGFDGVGVTLGCIVRPVRPLRVGVSWSPRVHLNERSRRTIEETGTGAVTTLRDSTVDATVHLPATVRLGAAAELGASWLLTGDWQWRDWTGFDGRLYGADSVASESRVGGGVEYHPRGAGIAGRLAYRLGVSRSTWPQRLGGDPVHETTVHLGTGFKLRGDTGRIDLALEYTRAGDVARNGYEENRWSFWLGLNGQETWRRKSPRSQ
jgi:hypothetical protein